MKSQFQKDLVERFKKSPVSGESAAGSGSRAKSVSPASGESPSNGAGKLRHGSVVIAAVTSCTNTSNPDVMLGAGLLAKKAAERGLAVPAWVKTSLAPGSKVVTRYLDEAGLTPYLEALGFHTVGYGCTTCIGNSGPLPEAIVREIVEGDLVAAAVLSGNRNFEGGSIPMPGPAIWPRRPSWWPTPWPGAWTSISPASPSAPIARAGPSCSPTSGPATRRSATWPDTP